MYLTVSEVNAYLGTSGEDALIQVLIDGAKSIFDIQIGSKDGLEQATYVDERYNSPIICSDGPGYRLVIKRHNPTSITDIDDVALVDGTDYIIQKRVIRLLNFPASVNTFPYQHEITYVAGYATIPDDVKQANYLLVSALYTESKSKGIDSFTQDKLTVTYGSAGAIKKLLEGTDSGNVFKTIVSSYKLSQVFTSGEDRLNGQG
jgi:hypothetical protein